jgi:hypothetical protein
VTFGKDPTARRRQDPDVALLLAQEIVRRHAHGESVREIARAVRLPRTSVHRTIQQYRAAQQAQSFGGRVYSRQRSPSAFAAVDTFMTRRRSRFLTGTKW